MSNLRIGYWPLSDSMTATGDRRRLVFWAKDRGHAITSDFSKKVDVIVASEKTDFNADYFNLGNTPIILDLVDGYLSPQNDFEDFARGLLKHMNGQIRGAIKPFSKHVRDFCIKSNAVVCSSIEQEQLIKLYNKNTHVILDSHDEIPFLPQRNLISGHSNSFRILWEGKPATIGGVNSISSALNELKKAYSLNFNFVTDESYFLISNTYIRGKTYDLLKKDLKQSIQQASIIPWSIENLVESAKMSSLAVIPLEISVPIQKMKPENRLLIMWRLGLPCLTADTPAYKRVSLQAGVDVICKESKQWVENIDRFLSDPKYAARQVTAGQNYLMESHSRAILLKKWDDAIASVLG